MASKRPLSPTNSSNLKPADDIASMVRARLKKPATTTSAHQTEAAASLQPAASAPSTSTFSPMCKFLQPRPFLSDGSISGFQRETSRAGDPASARSAPLETQQNLEHESQETTFTKKDAAHESAIFGKPQATANRQFHTKLSPADATESASASVDSADGTPQPAWKTLTRDGVCVLRRRGCEQLATVTSVTHQGFPNARYRVQLQSSGESIEVGADEVLSEHTPSRVHKLL